VKCLINLSIETGPPQSPTLLIRIKVPLPLRVSSNPSVFRIAIASRTTVRLTPKCSAIACSEGGRAGGEVINADLVEQHLRHARTEGAGGETIILAASSRRLKGLVRSTGLLLLPRHVVKLRRPRLWPSYWVMAPEVLPASTCVSAGGIANSVFSRRCTTSR
jgi:hypothetical protein